MWLQTKVSHGPLCHPSILCYRNIFMSLLGFGVIIFGYWKRNVRKEKNGERIRSTIPEYAVRERKKWNLAFWLLSNFTYSQKVLHKVKKVPTKTQ